MEVGGAIDLAGIAKYSGGIGLITSGSHTNLYLTGSGGLFLNSDNLSNLSSLCMLKVSPYIAFNMMENLTANRQSLDVYQYGGVNSTLGLGPVSFNFGQAANFEEAFISGPFAQTFNNYYNSYGVSLSLGLGASYSRMPTYTYYIFK